ncbi:hypothetical protein NEMIN01_1679 [Nematocida minor]|uniref:uncharacterized protein n=1 Tax=Nematocida minor TaxID=1912983 RepID=UPI00221EB599|nr:uncharacterized protein NEMIN01_1679 [Nematocida minor]KAI5191824.1 hypothetical protein NEMIN01_1679 [Nematocida minor]
MYEVEYTEILQRIAETLQKEERKNWLERECALLSLFTRLEIITIKNRTEKTEQMVRHTEIVKRIAEIVLRSKDARRNNKLIGIINNPF